MSNIITISIGEKEMKAWFEELYNRQHSMYKVYFENEYENIFYSDVETGQWIEEDLGFTELAARIGSQINKFNRKPVHVPKLLTWHKQILEDKPIIFGFFNFMKGNHKMYEIYNHNKKYMYTLVEMDNEEWQILGNSDLGIHNIDTQFIQHVIQILPLYSTI